MTLLRTMTGRALIVFTALEAGMTNAAAAVELNSSVANDWAMRAFPSAKVGTFRVRDVALPRTGIVLHHVKAVDAATGEQVGGTFDATGNLLGDHGEESLNAEKRAVWAERGAINAVLWDALQKAGPNEVLPVGIWLRATEAVPDKVAVEGDFVAAITAGVARELAHTQARSQFAAEFKPISSAAVVQWPGVPIVTMNLTPKEIIRIARLPSIGWIDLMTQPQAFTAGYTWVDSCLAAYANTGMTGAGEGVCMIEWKLPTSSTTLPTPTHTYMPSGSADEHTRVSIGAVRSTATPTGTAPGANIDLADWQSDVNRAGAAYFCATTAVDHVWNYPYANTTALDVAMFDYWVKQSPYPFISFASGNKTGARQLSQSLSYNGLIVGGVDEHGSASRTDDTIYDAQQDLNNSELYAMFGTDAVSYSDWEVPNIVAPATAIVSDGDTNWATSFGTSLAASQVAGIAAQVQDANAYFRTWPEAVRAVLMCAANRDVDGGRLSLVDSIDDRDGAGEVNAMLAVQMANSGNKVAPGNAARASGFDGQTAVPTGTGGQPDGSYLAGVSPTAAYAAVTSATGKRLRVVATWDATAGCTNSNSVSTIACTASQLDVDIDLSVVRHSDGVLMGSSNSFTSNYEFVEFAAVAGVQYDIKVQFWHWWTTSTYVGIAWNFDDYTSSL